MRNWVMMNDFTTKWDEIARQGRSAGRFRVGAEHSLDLFIAYSAAGEREFTLQSTSLELEDVEMPPFENLEVLHGSMEGNPCLTLRLTDRALKDLFSVICLDLAEASSRATTAAGAVNVFIERLKRWSELLRRRRSRGMSFRERLGLLGELSMLAWLLGDVGVESGPAARGWRGPDGDTNDIGINGTRIEVKAQVVTQTPRLRISSLEQLAHGGSDLFVALHRFTSSESGLSLHSLVELISTRLLLVHQDVMEFQRKLFLSGYDDEARYAQETFELEQRRIYKVTEGFPLLLPDSVPDGIVDARYEIACRSLTRFEISESDLEARIRA